MTSKYDYFRVDSNYTGSEGDPITGEPGYYMSQNAFAAIDAAFAAQQDNTLRINIQAGAKKAQTQTLASSGSAYGNVDLELNAGTSAKLATQLNVTSDWTWGKDDDDSSTIYLQNYTALKGSANVTLQGRTSIWMQGTAAANTTLAVTGTLTLNDESAIYGTGTISAKTLSLNDEASVILEDSAVTANLLNTAADAAVKLDSSTLTLNGDSSTQSLLKGTLEVLDSSTLTIKATIKNEGTISAVNSAIVGGTAITDLINKGTITLDNSTFKGAKQGLDNYGGTVYATGSNTEIALLSVDNDADGTITVKDAKTFSTTSEFKNAGEIVLNNVGTISLAGSKTVPAENSGTLTIKNCASAVTFTTAFKNSGTLILDETSKVTTGKNALSLGDESSIEYVLDEASAHITCDNLDFTGSGTATISVDMGDATGAVYKLVEASKASAVNCFKGYQADGEAPYADSASYGTLDVDFNGAKYEEFAFEKKINNVTADNDLYAVQNSNIQINYTANAFKNVTFDATGDWRVQGINWFSSLNYTDDTAADYNQYEAAALEATTWGTRTYELIYDDNAENDSVTTTNMTFLVTVDTGTTHVTIANKNTGDILSSFNTSTSRQVTVALNEGDNTDESGVYTITFEGENADYDFQVYFQDTIANSNVALGVLGTNTTAPCFTQSTSDYHTYTFTDKWSEAGASGDDSCDVTTNKVGFGTGAQTYTFTIDDNDSGLFTFKIGTEADPDALVDNDRISYRIEQTSGDGKTVAFGTVANGKTITRTANLLAGDYQITIDSYDHSAGNYNAIYSLDITAVRNENVYADDDTINGTAMKTLYVTGNTLTDVGKCTIDPTNTNAVDFQINWSVKDFVGLSDKTDWVKIDFDNTSGNYDIAIQTEEGTDSAGLRVNLVCKYADGRTAVIESMTYKGGTAFFKDVALDSTLNYYLQLSAPSATTDTYNSNYILGIHRVSANPGINHADDTRSGSFELAVKNYVSDWVGTEDTIDWIKLTGVQEGDNNLVFETQGDRMVATIYRVSATGTGATRHETGALQSLATLNLNDGQTLQRTLSCTGNYDYYVRIKAAGGSDVSTSYKLGLAAL